MEKVRFLAEGEEVLCQGLLKDRVQVIKYVAPTTPTINSELSIPASGDLYTMTL